MGIEKRDGNANVQFYQQDSLERMFLRLEGKWLKINRARMDCGSCSEEIVKMIEGHCKHFYIRANRCSSLYDDIFALRGWKREEINGQEFELNSILVEKWKGKVNHGKVTFFVVLRNRSSTPTGVLEYSSEITAVPPAGY